MGAMTWDDIEEQYQPVRVPTTLCLRNDLVTEIERLEAQLEQAEADDLRENRIPQAPKLAQRITELQQQAADAEVQVVFQGVEHTLLVGLETQHQPSPEEKAKGMSWSESFTAELIAASCVEPAGMTLERARRILTKWPTGERMKLWKACLAANFGTSEVPKALRAYALTRGSATNSD